MEPIVNPNGGAIPTPATPNTVPVASPAGDDTTLDPVEGQGDVGEGGEDEIYTADDVARLKADFEKAQKELESARRHCKQRDDELRKAKRRGVTDPQALEEIEREFEAERIKAEKEVEEIKREYAVKENTLEVKQILMDAAVSSADSTKLASFITSDDAEESAARAKALVSVINKVANSKIKEATNALLKENAEEPPNGGSTGAGATPNKVSPGALAAQRYNEMHKNK